MTEECVKVSCVSGPDSRPSRYAEHMLQTDSPGGSQVGSAPPGGGDFNPQPCAVPVSHLALGPGSHGGSSAAARLGRRWLAGGDLASCYHVAT